MRVIFKHLESEGFLSLGKVSVDFEGLGLVKVQGIANSSSFNIHESSNGAGKSSIFENIIWVLTGDTTRGVSSNEVINKYYKGYCYSELDFVVDDHEYKVIRSRQHPTYGTNLSIFIDGEDKSGKKLKESETLLQTYLPSLSTDILQSVIILGQGMPNKFTSLSPSGRKDRLEELSGSSLFIDLMKSKLTTMKLQLDTELANLRREESSLEGSILVYQSNITHSNETIKSLSANTTSSSEVNNKIQELSNQCDDLKSKLQELQDEKTQIITRKSQYQSSLTIHQSQRSTISQQLSELSKDICPTCKRPFTKTQDDYDKIAKLQSELDHYNEVIALLQSKISASDQSILSINNSISDINSQIINFTNQVTSLGQDLLKVTSTESQIESAKSIILKNEESIKLTQAQQLDIQSQISNIDKRLTAVNYLLQQMSREFRGYLLQEVINYLNTRAEYYSTKLSSNSKLSIMLEGNKISIYYNDRSYESLSGGERQRVDLSVQFALRDILSVSTGFSCNLLVLDEVFDNLDSLGSTNLIKLISSNNLGIDSVFIITHHSDIPIPCDTSLIVEKSSSGVSSIRME